MFEKWLVHMVFLELPAVRQTATTALIPIGRHCHTCHFWTAASSGKVYGRCTSTKLNYSIRLSKLEGGRMEDAATHRVHEFKSVKYGKVIQWESTWKGLLPRPQGVQGKPFCINHCLSTLSTVCKLYRMLAVFFSCAFVNIATKLFLVCWKMFQLPAVATTCYHLL